MGEYARTLTIALAFKQRQPNAQIHFILNRHASYAASTPFPSTLLPSSPTLHTKEVIATIRDFRPDVVVFDNAGRTAQLKAARRYQAKTIYITSRSRQRRKAFRLRWMRLLDEHWIAYPRFAAGEPTRLETLKLRLMGRPKLRYLDAIVAEPTPPQAAAVLKRLGLEPHRYILVVPGGGTAHSSAMKAPQIVADAATRLAHRGHHVVFVSGKIESATHPLLHPIQHLAAAELTAVIRQAQVVISNGGATMMQVLACRRPCVATPIAGDQGLRIARCEAAGVVTVAELNATALETAALSLLEANGRKELQLANMNRLNLTNSLDAALDIICGLVTRRLG